MKVKKSSTLKERFKDNAEITDIIQEDGSLKWNLPSGIEAHAIPGKVKHAVAAHRIIDGDQSLYIPAILAQLVKFNGAPMVMEDINEHIDLGDYNDLVGKLSEVNFI